MSACPVELARVVELLVLTLLCLSTETTSCLSKLSNLFDSITSSSWKQLILVCRLAVTATPSGLQRNFTKRKYRMFSSHFRQRYGGMSPFNNNNNNNFYKYNSYSQKPGSSLLLVIRTIEIFIVEFLYKPCMCDPLKKDDTTPFLF